MNPIRIMDNLKQVAGPFSFGEATKTLKAGGLVQRAGWNGKGMFVFRQVPATIEMDIIPKMTSVPALVKNVFASRGRAIHYNNQMAIVDKDNNISGWNASSQDVMAEDWYEVINLAD
jgi:hypothetical protein